MMVSRHDRVVRFALPHANSPRRPHAVAEPSPTPPDHASPDAPASAPACAVCGHEAYAFTPVLWDDLVRAWGLSDEERWWVDRQQGQRCLGCGCNLRSIALARALTGVLGRPGVTLDAVLSDPPAALRLLELNGAGGLSGRLTRLPGHTAAAYPEADLENLPYADGAFDLVVHSDTLEHVPDASRALRECRRVLAPGGVLVFTAPLLDARLTRDREGLEASYHGSRDTRRDDFLVRWEFGADLWAWPVRAGFDRVEAWPFAYPAAVAWAAWRDADEIESAR